MGQTLSKRTTLHRIPVLTTVLFACVTFGDLAFAGETPPIVVSQPQRSSGSGPRQLNQMPPKGNSRWGRLARSIPRSVPGFRNRYAIPPIVVAGNETSPTPYLDAPERSRVQNSTVGRVRLIAVTADQQNLSNSATRTASLSVQNDDDSDGARDDDSKDGQQNDADASDEDSEEDVSAATKEANKAPAKRFVPLSELFARMESIDVGRAAVQSLEPESEITFPENLAGQHVGRPRRGVTLGNTGSYLYQHGVPITHHPLYFENVTAERCGVGQGCLTTWSSAARFFGRIPLVPYMITAEPYRTRVAPKSCGQENSVFNLSELQTGPVLVETLAVSALVFLVP